MLPLGAQLNALTEVLGIQVFYLSLKLEQRQAGDGERKHMAAMKSVTFHLRNGEQRTYKNITRVDTSRPHTVLIYSQDVLTAQIAKPDIIKMTQQDSA